MLNRPVDTVGSCFRSYIYRHLSPDSIVPNPADPQSYNRYAYVRNNPINFTDPSGHCLVESESGRGPCKTQNPNNSIQYDLTAWIAREMVINAQTDTVTNVRYFVENDIVLSNGIPQSGGNFITAMGMFYPPNSNSGIWNIKEPINDLLGGGIVLCGDGGCRWVDYSTPGNIHFGFIAAASSVPEPVFWTAGGLLEAKDSIINQETYTGTLEAWFDNPQDKAAVDFGHRLFQEFGINMTNADFQKELSVDLLETFQPPKAGFVPHGPAIPQWNNYSVGAFNNVR